MTLIYLEKVINLKKKINEMLRLLREKYHRYK
jgi:hypothetical protein